MRTSFLARSLALALPLLCGACRFGDAQFTGAIDGIPFDPGGTVFSYLDVHDANLASDTDPRVVVAMTWIAFDPSSDLSDRSGAELDDDAHELAQRDALALVFDHQGAVDAGKSYKSVVVGDVENGADGMTARVHLAPERLSNQTTFAAFAPFASKRTVDVKLTSADFKAATPVIAGTITLSFTAVPGTDPGTAREGSYTGTFSAPLVDERVAEHNLSLLLVKGSLGLPLDARAATVTP